MAPSPSPLPSPSSLAALSADLADIVERAAAFVVAIDSRHRRLATGLIFGADLVVTADHVVERDTEIAVYANGRRLAATLAGRDPAVDIAVLRVPDLGGTTLSPAGALRTGHLAISVSRTGSGDLSTGLGTISAIGGPVRTGRGIVFKRVIRTDAAARPGTSGGAIVDTAGSVIAMTTSGLLRGLPVGIPLDELSDVVSALASGAPSKRAFLGVSVQPVKGGLLIFGVAPEGAADRAGLMIGDIIVGLNDARLAHADDLQDRLAAAEAGAPATLSILRGGVAKDVGVTLGARPSA
jgi:serine protease DegQ